MIATMGAMAALLVYIMLMQFRTIEQTDIAELENMREAELRTEISSWKTKYEETNKKLVDTQTKIAEYNEKINNNDETTGLLEKELLQNEIRLGTEAVTGPGIVVTLTDNELSQIDAYDLYKLINELRLAGAEAISINDMRITSMTYVKDVTYGVVAIDGNTRVTSPYVIKAIGNQTYLESGLTLKTYGYMDHVIKDYEKTGTLERQNDIIIEAAKSEMKLKYAEEVKK